MADYFTELGVSINKDDEQQLHRKGFKKIDVNLNKGVGADTIFLWFKKQSGEKAITKIQFTFNDDMTDGLTKAGYIKIPKDLNAGTGGDEIFLWYFKGSGEFQTAITDIDITTNADNEASKFGLGFESLACDLNRNAGGNSIYIWVKREKQTYICDVTATASHGADYDNFTAGYTRVDENTNRGERRGDPVFIWYRQTTDRKKAVNDLQISTNAEEYQHYEKEGYQQVIVNLNEGTGGNDVYMWYKKGSIDPIKDVVLLLDMSLVPQYRKVGVTVIDKNLNTGNDGRVEYLCYYNK